MSRSPEGRDIARLKTLAEEILFQVSIYQGDPDRSRVDIGCRAFLTGGKAVDAGKVGRRLMNRWRKERDAQEAARG